MATLTGQWFLGSALIVSYGMSASPISVETFFFAQFPYLWLLCLGMILIPEIDQDAADRHTVTQLILQEMASQHDPVPCFISKAGGSK
jgi:hypothetical protein